MSIAGELLVAAVDVSAFEKELGAVAERIFDGVRVEVLIDEAFTIGTSARAHGLDGPGVLHPAAFVDVVDEEVAIAAAAGPKEAVEPLDLIQQLVDVGRLWPTECRPDRPRLAIRTQRDDVANDPVLDAIEKVCASRRSGGT